MRDGESMGVPAISVDTAEGPHDALARSVCEAGPKLIEVRLY